MRNFKNDYSVGAHPNIIKRLMETNNEEHFGYGNDYYSNEARKLLRDNIGKSNSKIFFLSGGTQTNLITIAFLLRPHEAVISTLLGHISSNETGAIESTGHKIITVDNPDGKLYPKDIEGVIKQYSLQPHVVRPRLVFISNSTEVGTIYTKEDLTELSRCCKSHELLLYLDGARLGHALMANNNNNNLSLPDVSDLTDVFYIGGTKNGALLGEALVFNDSELARDFEFVLKQKGGMLAKGRLLAIQFLELFKDNLYFRLAEHANIMALKLTEAISECGYSFLTQSTTNQIFPILPNPLIEQLSNKYSFYVWKEINDELSAVRFVTSWATDESHVNELIMDIRRNVS